MWSILLKDPSKVWKYSQSVKAQSTSGPEKRWVVHFARNFNAPNKRSFMKNWLTLFFQIRQKSCLFTSPNDVHSLVSKLNKNYFSGVDSISARHLQLAGPLIEQYLAILFLMILVCGVVPMYFSNGQITLILEKDKTDAFLYSSYCLITTFCTTFKLFESFLMRDIVEKCSTPHCQFGYPQGLGEEHALFILTNGLKDIEDRCAFLVLCTLNAARALNSCIFL